MSLHDHEPTGRDRPLSADDAPPEEDLDDAEVAEEVEESPEGQRNYTEDHPIDERMTEDD